MELALDIANIAREQGWNEDTLLDLALDYIRHQQDNDAFIDYLREVQNNENGL